MLTPQEVSEHAFAKASFGGYNMAMVDEFLDQLTEDYGTLYKENAVLKSKMKVLVDKVEEYRSTEEAMRKALLTAQKMADQMVQEAEQKKAELIGQAEAEARERIAGLRREAEAEQLRLTAAQNAATAYIAKAKELCQHELDYLDGLSQSAPPAEKPADPVVTAAQDIEASMHRIMEEVKEDEADTKELPQLAPEAPGGLYDDLKKAAAQEEAPEEAPEAPEAPADPTRRIDFEHLQFGKDYEIK